MSTNQIHIVSDNGGTLSRSGELVAKLVALQQNGLSICVASDSNEGDFGKYILPTLASQDLNPDFYASVHTFGGCTSKNDKDYWSLFCRHFKIEKESILFIDDDSKNCKNAEASGITALEFNAEDSRMMLQTLEGLLRQKGYNGPF